MNAVLTLPSQRPRLFLLVAVAAWFVAYQMLTPVSEILSAMLPVARNSHLGDALQFFLYDTPKVLLLLAAVVFVMGMVNSYFTPEHTRALLAGRAQNAAHRHVCRRGRERHPGGGLRVQCRVIGQRDDIMKSIKVLGTGCANCRATVQRIEQVAKELGTPIALEKVEEIQDIMGYGILATPGVVVDDKVVHSGGVPAREKIAGWLGPGEESVASAEPIASGCGCGGHG